MKAQYWLGIAILVGFLFWFFSGRKEEAGITRAELEAPLSKPPAPPAIEAPAPKPALVSPARPAASSLPPERKTEEKKSPEPARPLVETTLRDGDGNVIKTNQRDAAEACARSGMHLPSIREQARLAMQRGAKGILEVSQVREQDKADGYELVTALGFDGAKDEFYYNPKGYVRHAGEKPEQAYWSASICKGCETPGGADSSHALYESGEIHDHYDSVILGVRCVSGR